jgi:hypothetical protein
MPAETKTNREPAVEEAHDKKALHSDTAAFFLYGMERIAEIQKRWIDLATQHTEESVEILKKAADKGSAMPRLPLLEVANGAIKGYADTQKAAIDFVVEQGRVWTDMFKDPATTVKKSTESTSNIAKETIERSFAVQKKALDHAAAQTKAVVDATRRQFGLTGTQGDVLTDTFQRGVDTVVDAQKELLDLVTH